MAGGEKTLQELVHEYKTKGPRYDRTVRATLKASYTSHYAALRQPLDPNEFMADLGTELEFELDALNRDLPKLD